jgi:predicted small secreted protein
MIGSTKYLIAIVAASFPMAFMNTASAMGEDISDLKKLISVNEEDIRMNTVRSTDSHNGDKPGLCDTAF